MTPPGVEILAIGNELLLGETVDTNSAWLAQRLAREGIGVIRITVVGDDVAAIGAALRAALERTRAVICTGGLGPTVDDLTRHAVAAVYERHIVVAEEWVDVLRARYAARRMAMPEINRVQAELPEGAELVPNARGTAPGIIIDDGRLGWTAVLPGVPAEMRGLVEDAILARLRDRLRPETPLESRLLRTTGIGESALAELVAGIVADPGPVQVAFLPQVAGVDLRLTCSTDAAAVARLAQLEEALRTRLGSLVYAVGAVDLAAVVGEALQSRGLVLALAESCTGGLLAKRLTDAAGASAYIHTGFVTYANEAKRDLLGVRPETLAMHGAVSEACAREMAEGARSAAHADTGIGITGIAGPGGGTEEKPVGLVWIAAAVGEHTVARRFHFLGDRAEIRERAAQAALDLLRRRLLGLDE